MSSEHGGIRSDVVPIAQKRIQSLIDLDLGDFREAASLWQQEIGFGPQGVTYSMHSMLAQAQLGEHDLHAARATMADPGEPGGVNPEESAFEIFWTRMLVSAEARDWPAMLSEQRGEGALVFAHYPTAVTLAPTPHNSLACLRACESR